MSAIVRRNQGWVPSILGDLLGGEWLDTRTPSGIIPAINVKETKKDYLVEVAAPGLTKEDFNVHLNENNDLVICMERKTENKEEDKDTHYLRKEFSYSRFQQTMLLPDDVKRDAIDAHVDDSYGRSYGGDLYWRLWGRRRSGGSLSKERTLEQSLKQ